jgi:trehalose utilization protein
MPPLPNDETADAPSLPRRKFVRQLAAISAAAWASAASAQTQQAPKPIRVRIWCEGTAPRDVYPKDVDGALGDDLAKRKGFDVSRARLGDPDAGLSDAQLDATDTLIWWGRLRHDELPEARAKAIAERVKAGTLGFVALHGSYASKPFIALMGKPCAPRSWRDDGRPERVIVKAPDHPIAKGVAEFTIPRTATYSEPFAVPDPETVVLVSSFEGDGQTFRSGLTWRVGKGRVAYFRPGHDGFPVLFHPAVRQVIANAASWSAGRA